MDSERLITKYFLNQLSVEERKEFDILMGSDADFREQVIFEQNLKTSLFQQEHAGLKNRLRSIETNLALIQNKTKWYLIAASILLLISVSLFWNQISKNPERLFTDYYKVAANTTYPIVRNNDSNSDISNAFIAYEREAYNEAQIAFKNLYNTTNNTELLFYEAICHIEMDSTQLAIETFIKHQKFNDKLVGKSQWYLALAYLRANEKSKAKNLLEEISSSTSNYNYDMAKDLLSKF